MDISKADYAVIIKFGTLDDLKSKLKQDEKRLEEIIDMVGRDNTSLVEQCLISRKFEIAKYLLRNQAKVNVISSNGCNELHYIAPNINKEGAIEVARILVDKNVSLEEKESRYNNSALFTLCQEILKVRSIEGLEFLEHCLMKCQNVDERNNMGYSIRSVIEERGTDRLKKILEEK